MREHSARSIVCEARAGIREAYGLYAWYAICKGVEVRLRNGRFENGAQRGLAADSCCHLLD